MQKEIIFFSNLITTDIQISRIHTICHLSQSDWKRPNPQARHTNGLIFITEGSILYNFSGEEILAQEGDILKLPKGLVYSGISLTDINSFYVIDFDTIETNEYANFPIPLVFHPTNRDCIEHYFEKLLLSWNQPAIGYHLQHRYILYELLYDILLSIQSTEENRNELLLISKATDYIHQNYACSDLYIHNIAIATSISESQLRRLFQKILHQSPLAYLQTVRLGHAKNLLLYSTHSISSISELCGFSSFYYFSKLFKQQVGMSPSEYRSRGE